MADHWLIWIIVSAPVLATLLVYIWLDSIRPRLMPAAEIEALAAELIEKYGDQAANIAGIEEDRAWRYSQPFERGKWKRVRRAIGRR